MKNKLLTAVASLFLLLASSSASAVLIEGGISFDGASITTVAGGQVTSIEFAHMETELAYGDFSVIADDTTALFTDLAPVAAQTGLWSVGGFTFDLVQVTLNGTLGSSAVVEGTGVVTSTNPDYDATAFTWLYSTQGTFDGNETNTFSAKAVPAPAGIALLGLGLIAFGFIRRYRK